MKFLKNNRLVYFGYFLKKTNWKKFFSDLDFVASKTGKHKISLIFEVFFCSVKHGTSFHEYFYYSFWKIPNKEKATYASSAFMYEFQLKANPVKYRSTIENKAIFLKNNEDVTKRDWLDVSSSCEIKVEKFFHNKVKVVLKNATGKAGREVKIITPQLFNGKTLKSFAKANNLNLMEDYVVQHPFMENLSSRSLNTIRIITLINGESNIAFLGAVLRIGFGKGTDNLSTGGVAFPVDIKDGLITGPGVSFDIRKPPVYQSPETNQKFVGLKIPFWPQCLLLAEKIALRFPQVRSVGWDIAITTKGPIVIEGNHDWGARLWQMPHKKGLRYLIENYKVL